MRQLLRSFLLFISAATDKELARMVEFRKTENQILPSRLPKQVVVTPEERNRLLKLGRKLGSKIKALISIVSYRTFCRWLKRDSTGKVAPAKRGRKPTPGDIQSLILKVAEENPCWGYTSILGELKELGIRSVSKTTVPKIHKDHGFDPGPQRGPGSWADFI
jgi:putative transposase